MEITQVNSNRLKIIQFSVIMSRRRNNVNVPINNGLKSWNFLTKWTRYSKRLPIASSSNRSGCISCFVLQYFVTLSFQPVIGLCLFSLQLTLFENTVKYFAGHHYNISHRNIVMMKVLTNTNYFPKSFNLLRGTWPSVINFIKFIIYLFVNIIS